MMAIGESGKTFNYPFNWMVLEGRKYCPQVGSMGSSCLYQIMSLLSAPLTETQIHQITPHLFNL